MNSINIKLNKKKDRIAWIDYSKAILIILVVFGHLGTWFPRLSPIIKYIYTFHMAAFFFLSGIVFDENKYTFIEFLKKGIRTLVLPYCIFSSISMTSYIIEERFSPSFICTLLFDNFIMGEGLWFFLALFFCEIAAFFLLKVKMDKLLMAVLLAALSTVFYKYVSIDLPFSLVPAFYALPFFVIGHVFKRKSKMLNNKKVSIIVFCVGLIMSVSLFLHCFLSINETIDFNHIVCPWYWILSLVGIITVCSLSSIFSAFFRSPLLMLIGQRTLIIYALNDFILKILKLVFFVIFRVDISEFPYCGEFIIGIAFIVVTVFIICILSKYIYKYAPWSVGIKGENN